MTVLSLLFVLALIGLVTWALVTFIPMPGNIKTIIVVVAGIIAILYVLSAFGVLGSLNIRVPTLRG